MPLEQDRLSPDAAASGCSAARGPDGQRARVLGLLVAGLVAGSVAGCGSCPPAAGSEPVVAVTGADTDATKEIVSAAESFANTTCQCTSPSCAENARSDFVEWLRAHPDRSGSAVAAKRVLVAMEKMLLCANKLAHPEEPVDLDSPSSTEGEGGAPSSTKGDAPPSTEGG